MKVLIRATGSWKVQNMLPVQFASFDSRIGSKTATFISLVDAGHLRAHALTVADWATLCSMQGIIMKRKAGPSRLYIC